VSFAASFALVFCMQLFGWVRDGIPSEGLGFIARRFRVHYNLTIITLQTGSIIMAMQNLQQE
jgi:hypothetical protein